MESLCIAPRLAIDAVVSAPGSKSCTARALLMAALSHGESTILDPADCDDADHMLNGLAAFGIPVKREANIVNIRGRALREPEEPVFLGNSGTAVRFLAAACASLKGRAVLDGNSRMRQRPIADLLEALRPWGIDASAPTGCPPVEIRATGSFGGETQVDGDASSQYLSGLLMAAPLADRDVAIYVKGELVSKPYVELTIHMMAERGVSVVHEDYSVFRVPSQQFYRPGAYHIEADASAASYFFAAAAVTAGRVCVTNLSFSSRQGDAQFPRVLERMGCHVAQLDTGIEVCGPDKLQGINIDLNDMPDMAQTLAVVALFADGPTIIRNVANLRIKETDRLSAMATELRKLGATIEEYGDGLMITPGRLHGAEIDTYDDHRMAMSLAVAGLRIPGVVIRDPDCVSKTFPDFFQRLSRL